MRSTNTRAPAYASKLATTIEQVMKGNVIPGAVVMIGSRELGDWTATFGTGTIGEDRPISVGDSFRIGSNTKTMTSTAILQLVQEGALGLDDPIAKYEKGVPNGDAITIAHLSEMRSGLTSYSFDPTFNATLDEEPQKAWTPQELLDIAYGHPPQFAPGTAFDYSNTNTVLLGLVIEKLTGMSLSDAFEERIFRPLGMAHTSLPAATDASIPDPHPRGYQFGTNVATITSYALPEEQRPGALAGTLRPIDQTDANPSWAWAAGGAISTVGDLTTYVRKLVGGGLLDAQTQRIRLGSIRPTNPAHPDGGGYGLGIAAFGPLLGHDGQIPGYMTFMGYDPNADLAIVIMTNLAAAPVTGEGSALTILKGMLPAFYPGLPVPEDPAARPATTP